MKHGNSMKRVNSMKRTSLYYKGINLIKNFLKKKPH